MRARSPKTSPPPCRTIRAGQASSRPKISRNYRAKVREPVCVLYRGFEVCGAAPPSSGAIAVGQVLALIEPFDLGGTPLEVEPVHLIVEAERLAFADRDRYLADPDFVTAPVSGLLDRTYLDQRRALIDPNRALGEVTAGTPPNTRQGAYGRDATLESVGTSHISIVDDDGNAVSMTTSIEQAFGNRAMVRGFLLNNQLTDFSFVSVDDEGRPVANRVEPGKRPRSSMDPTMIFAMGPAAGERRLRFLLGSPGGPGIILFNLKAIIAMLDWHLDPQAATALANFGSTGGAFLLEPGRNGMRSPKAWASSAMRSSASTSPAALPSSPSRRRGSKAAPIHAAKAWRSGIRLRPCPKHATSPSAAPASSACGRRSRSRAADTK